MVMPWQMWVCAVVSLSTTFCSPFPLRPTLDDMQDFVPTDFNLVDNAVGFIPDDVPFPGLPPPRNPNSALSALEEGINQIQKNGWWNGGKESLQDGPTDNLVGDLKAVLWKLAAAEKLRSQAFVKADRSSPQKQSKRACFWKYCVTN